MCKDNVQASRGPGSLSHAELCIGRGLESRALQRSQESMPGRDSVL